MRIDLWQAVWPPDRHHTVVYRYQVSDSSINLCSRLCVKIVQGYTTHTPTTTSGALFFWVDFLRQIENENGEHIVECFFVAGLLQRCVIKAIYLRLWSRVARSEWITGFLLVSYGTTPVNV